jgi:superfamily II DNA or RNA helicase
MSRFSKYRTNTKKDKQSTFTLTEEYKAKICTASYLGKKGYTIPKSLLLKEDEDYLRKELFVKPEVMGATFGNPSDEESAFPVFRENTNKFYLPRFYGINRYGLPSRSEISPGQDIHVTFPKPLRDYQEKIIGVYTNYVDTPICSESVQVGSGGILQVPCGQGKTIMALKIISNLKKKTLIIVHKEFLMNQWIDRIAEFLPGASVGKIQGKVFDIEGKDIVIGMVQTLYDKEFHPDAFSQFGLTIIDEVHRIGSEQFSRTLFKTITPYMLGISATVDRKDKLTKVLHMFIGDMIYSEDRQNDDLVTVRAINYVANDTEFNEVERDFRGNPKYSTMIVKLCSYGPRSDFIIKVVGDLLAEDSTKQIMILCHNRSLLTYLYEGIMHRDLASVGYYVGGMKQEKLQETEQKQIVLATYAMAAEALDIKTLSSLIMVTPKTDITQSIGRILRVKHANPIVVDIVDKHDIFQNQWAQRRRFYKKCNYRIRQIDSLNYKGMSFDWKTDQTWKRIFEPKNSEVALAEPEGSEEEEEGEEKPTYQSPIKGTDKGKCLIDIQFEE